MAINWTCPYCDHKIILQDDDIHSEEVHLPFHGKRLADGSKRVRVTSLACPNEQCRQLALTVHLLRPSGPMQRPWQNMKVDQLWQLMPESLAKPQPNYIPGELVADYSEACRIVELSPKASATLSRRCLQGMIRDFWGVADKPNLFQEIEAIKDKVDAESWEAIDAVRHVGNIGAHMQRDINLIIPVEPEEAELLIQLIETLFGEWYVAKHQRSERMAALKELGEAKNPKNALPEKNSELNGNGKTMDSAAKQD
ncbi:MAG: DUF4145 domain-containing protein [Rhodospirillaceae bacterium]|jgi:hypothetical protein|nr:DUF4145 domain-containing protein [Rhodospirillaceae bacterium]MBT4770927.1 DUF4145 domain-containing protein [Rhodospirillaceae bacterium]MBT5359278.1 DUF4145 domain-containing protein [Rhodospirillaceae bacterium]MBT5769147.1 DUF4145 domain-containing protein [Rhodospirillaceae bacterium]MBT6310501.1 DUF4145 domain-containing protein [Rhodospirillaceae bacterium]